MAIHFNDTWFAALDSVYFYDASANTRTARTGTTPDLFPDDAAVDDCLYFFISISYAQFSGLELAIPTPLAATSITGVWEYGKYVSGSYTWSWTALSGLTDNTNNLTTSGTNQVTWTCPTDWENRMYPMGTTTEGKAYQFCIRFRITAISGITEGGTFTRASTKFRPYDIIIDAGTSGTPSTFTDIYDADVAGGWGVVTKNERSFVFNCNLRLGTNYYLKSQNENITFLTNWQTYFADGYVQIGTLYSGNKVYQGSSFIWYMYHRDLSTGNFYGKSGSYFYNSQFRCVFNGSVNQGFWSTPSCGGCSVIDCYFENVRQVTFNVEDAANYVGGVKATAHIEGAGSLIDGFVPFACSNGWRLQHSTTIVRTVHNCDFSKVITAPLNPYYYNNDNNACRCVDCNFGTFAKINWARWYQPGTNNKIYCTISFLLRVLDKDGTAISGATVSLVDKNGTSVFSYTTNSDGYCGEDYGAGSGYTSSSLSDTSKSWSLNQWRFREALITSGSAAGERRFVHYHASGATTLPIVPNFQTTPSTNDRYIMIPYVDYVLLEPITPEYFDWTWSVATEYNPFTLTISKSGYKTYVSTMTLEKAANLVITLDKVKTLNFSKHANSFMQ